MRKIIVFLLSVLIIFLFAACGKNNSEITENIEPIPDKEIENTKEKIYNVSIVTDKNFSKPSVEKVSDISPQKFVKAEDTIMEGKTLEIWEKYISPIESGMPLALDFDEENAPNGNIAIYSYIYYQCENLDYKYYGIEKSGFDMAENCWADGRKTEESIARWFPWKPEDYREYFEYNEENDKYFIPGCGGGLEKTYISNYQYEGDYLIIDFSFYNNFSENGIHQIFSSHTLTIKPEETGWKYISNKKTYEYEHLFSWTNDDGFFGANMIEWNPGNKADFEIFCGNELYLLTVYGATDYYFYMDEKPCAIFISKLGLIIYDFESNSIRIVDTLPSTCNDIHETIDVQREAENAIAVFYRDIKNHDAQTAILDYGTLEVLSHNE